MGVSSPPPLPDVASAVEAVRAWAAASPELARSLGAAATPAQAATQRGVALLREGRVADAIAALGAAVALSPDDASPWTRLGVALDRSGRAGEAAWCLERSVALAPEQPEAWVLLGLAREKNDDVAGAEAAYRAALDRRPTLAAAWQCLGLLLERRRDHAAAAEAFLASARLGEGDGADWANVGRLRYQMVQLPEACAAYEAALRRDPANPHYRRMLRKASFMRDLLDAESVDAVLAARAPSLAPAADEGALDAGDLLEAAAGLLAKAGRAAAALRVAEKRLELAPSSAAAKYLVRVLGGDPAIARCPPEFIEETFDAFADHFDAKLVGLLGYDVPGKLCALVGAALPPGGVAEVLDGGCGTGLCGPLLRPLAARLTGVDLSPRMLERAATREVYDDLVREELVAFLARSPGRFDAIVAADVFIYLGDLSPVFAAAALALREGGVLAFSTELLDDTGDPAAGYRALPSGRFAHAPAYVRRAAGAAFVEEACAPTTLRQDGASRVPGQLFVLRMGVVTSRSAG